MQGSGEGLGGCRDEENSPQYHDGVPITAHDHYMRLAGTELGPEVLDGSN